MNDKKKLSADAIAAITGKTKVETSNILISDGRITARQRPSQVTYRLPYDTVNWLSRHVDGNTNYAVFKILEFGISKIKEKIVEGDFDIEDIDKL